MNFFLSQNPSIKPQLIVMKGFWKENLIEISSYKLFSNTLDCTVIELNESKQSLFLEATQIYSNRESNIYWCTFEEYLTLNSEFLNAFYDIKILKNNLFYQTFPNIYKIQNPDKILSYYEEIDLDFDNDADIEAIKIYQGYYGYLDCVCNQFIVTYANSPEDIYEINLFEKSDFDFQLKSEYINEHQFVYEFGETESEFFRLIHQLKYSNIIKKVYVNFDKNEDQFLYSERTILLANLFNNEFDIVYAIHVTKTKTIDDSAYLEIIGRWGFNSFRDLKVYKNIDDPVRKKELISVSQAQVIDDIVQQSIKSSRGEPFSDVFLTSPTGAGKSVMFQVPAIYLAERPENFLTIVISPLIGLMNDQVRALIDRSVNIGATINSGISPIEKRKIVDEIQEGTVSILYISPETLLSRSDIKDLIGARKIGLFVIDEAHIVTTWGKAFRSDYWYLGSYLQRLRREMNFPIATFTATAIYGGVEDMYLETRDSLNLINPITYFGYIKRDNLKVKINQATLPTDKVNEYRESKFKILAARLNNFLYHKKKVLVYFPIIKLISQFKEYANTFEETKDIYPQLCEYYGSLDRSLKEANFLKFKNGESNIMLATKAFGMGIDIKDIDIVYHFAPTGNVCDYVQEIGRAARNLNEGNAYFDYLQKDFMYVKQLHGISTLQNYQLIQVVSKLIDLYNQAQNTKVARSFLIRAEEFRYIFDKSRNQDSDIDIDNKLKTALLIIEKDFRSSSLRFPPLIARPRSIFANEYFMVNSNVEQETLEKYSGYFKLVRKKVKQHDLGSIFNFNLKKFWEDYYPDFSYAEFKYKFHNKQLNLPFNQHILQYLKLNITLKSASYSSFIANFNKYVDVFSGIFGEYARTNKYLDLEAISEKIVSQFDLNKYQCNTMIKVFIYSAASFNKIQKRANNHYNNFMRYYEDRDKYQVISPSFIDFFNWIKRLTTYLIREPEMKDNCISTYVPKSDSNEVDKLFILLGILENFGLIIYEVNGGESPEIFVRINSKYHLSRILSNPNNYRNKILENVHKRHKISVEMLTYLFKNEVKTDFFWDKIEDYFLGVIPDEVWAAYRSNTGTVN